MTKKYVPEPTEAEVKKRLKEFSRKHREKYPVPPIDENEPEGFLAGDPEKIKERIEEEFEDDFGEDKPQLKVVKNNDE
ncbi:MAG: hypothetical protein K6L81_17790 [Agarilytica sp.]